MLPWLSLTRIRNTRRNAVNETAVARAGSAREMNGRGQTLKTHHRVPSDQPVRVAWVDQPGHLKCITGRCIDVSGKRIHLELGEQIPRLTRVTLRSGEISTPVAAYVKYATRHEAKFILVLELFGI
ncbi:MAG TPA: hypothetical protein VMB85_25105 [Bryobacteraceae bacterium]|jgi:hypothetical protein|nr:hypothetical protein [Bryobacteraceae bacterium]